jgi:hypothetical protein
MTSLSSGRVIARSHETAMPRQASASRPPFPPKQPGLRPPAWHREEVNAWIDESLCADDQAS